MSRSGANLALLLLGGFRSLVDTAIAELALRGYEDVVPVHDFAMRAIAAGIGIDALVPSPRQPSPRTPEEVLALAEALKRERPGRTAAQVRRILQQTAGWAPSDRTLQRLFERLELGRPAPAEEDQRAFGRFECARPNESGSGTLSTGRRSAGRSRIFSRSSTTTPGP